MFAPGLYAIADADHTPDVEAWGNTLLASGAKTLQLRAKSWSKSEITRVARALVTSAHRYGAVFILNDHPDIAATVHAHGVHLGQTDMSTDEARAIVGPDVLIGLSTHTIDQVEKTKGGRTAADYLGFGPIFGTSSKAEAGLPRGASLLAEAVHTADIPVVAIGGIDASRLQEVVAAGPFGWAVISALTGAHDPVTAIREMSPSP